MSGKSSLINEPHHRQKVSQVDDGGGVVNPSSRNDYVKDPLVN